MYAAVSLARAGFNLGIDAKIVEVHELNDRYVQAVMAPKSAGVADEVKYRLVRDLDASCLQLVLDMMSRFRGDLDAAKTATEGVIEWWGWPPCVSEEDWIGQLAHRSRNTRVLYRETRTGRNRHFLFEITYPNNIARGGRPSLGLRCLLMGAEEQKLIDIVPPIPFGGDYWKAPRHHVALLGVARQEGSDFPVVICTYGRTGSGAFFRHHTLRYDTTSQTWEATYPIGETSGVRRWSFDEETLTFSLEVAKGNRTGIITETIDLKRFGYTPIPRTDAARRGQNTVPDRAPLQLREAIHEAQHESPDAATAQATRLLLLNGGTAWPYVVIGLVIGLVVAAAGAWLLLRRRSGGRDAAKTKAP